MSNRHTICLVCVLVLATLMLDHAFGTRYECEQLMGGELVAVDGGTTCVLSTLNAPEPPEPLGAIRARAHPAEPNGSTARAAGDILEEPWQLVAIAR
jgi:hypothetical protein